MITIYIKHFLSKYEQTPTKEAKLQVEATA